MKPRPVRSVLRYILKTLFRLLSRLKVEGVENLPSGGYLLAVNHLSSLDPALVFMLVDRPDMTALVAKKHQKNAFFRWLVNQVGGIWLNRDEADAQALRAARNLLQSGGVLGIAPEGTRSPTRALIPGKHGVAFLASQANVPVVPVAITGTEHARQAFLLMRPRIQIRFGQPFILPPLDRKDREASLALLTEEIMLRIAAMLPEPYRGVYAGHPGLHAYVNVPAEQSTIAAQPSGVETLLP